MTAVDEASGSTGGPDDAEEAGSVGADAGSSRRWPWEEVLLAVELGGLAAFAFGRAVLDTFGRSPETFVARGADAATIVAFGVIVLLGPFVVLGLIGLASRPFGPTVRRRVHLVLVGIVGGFAVWQIGQGVLGYPPESQKLIIAGVIGGVALAFLRASVESLASFLRFVGCASVIFLVQFLLMSPTSAMVVGDGPELADDVSRSVAADLGDDPPDVVVLLFDALPTASMLDGTGRIDAELFPNFARLAATSSWYRNNTTVATFTAQAIPAILTGRYSNEGPDLQDARDENLFTLLGGSYEVHGREVVTRLCPSDLCSAEVPDGGLAPLLADAGKTWVGAEGGGHGDGEFDLPGALGTNRYDTAADWAAEQSAVSSRPQLYVQHAVLPHNPWYLTDDAEQYRTLEKLPLGSLFMGWAENGAGLPVAIQRHTLQAQAADRLLGDLLDRLEESGRFDDSMIVVTADHGNGFLAGQPERSLTEENMEHVLWTPLLVKAPGQTEAMVDDSNTMSIDVLPTIADGLGVDLPWDVDGMPVGEAANERDDDTKSIVFHKANIMKPPEGESRLEIEDTGARFEHLLGLDLVEGTGVDAAWKHTAYGELFGKAVDEVDVGDEGSATLEVAELGELEGSTTDRPMIEVMADTDLPEGTVVAYALNGTIGALAAVQPNLSEGTWAHGLLPTGLFRDGDNELTAYVVDGPPERPVLHPLTIAAADDEG